MSQAAECIAEGRPKELFVLRRSTCAAIALCCGLTLPSACVKGETDASRKTVALRVFEEIFNQGRFDAGSELYAPDFVNHGVNRDIGLREDQAALRGWKAAVPDLRMTVHAAYADGEFVTVLWRATGTNTASGNGLPATGRTLNVRGITIWRISDFRIKEEWTQFDEAGVLLQLGLLAPVSR